MLRQHPGRVNKTTWGRHACGGHNATQRSNLWCATQCLPFCVMAETQARAGRPPSCSPSHKRRQSCHGFPKGRTPLCTLNPTAGKHRNTLGGLHSKEVMRVWGTQSQSLGCDTVVDSLTDYRVSRTQITSFYLAWLFLSCR